MYIWKCKNRETEYVCAQAREREEEEKEVEKRLIYGEDEALGRNAFTLSG